VRGLNPLAVSKTDRSAALDWSGQPPPEPAPSSRPRRLIRTRNVPRTYPRAATITPFLPALDAYTDPRIRRAKLAPRARTRAGRILPLVAPSVAPRRAALPL